MDLGPLRSPQDLATGNDAQPWADISSWTVTRWGAVLDRCRDLLILDEPGRVKVPGLDEPVYPAQLAALVHRTTQDPDRDRWRLRVALFGWLDAVERRQARFAWRVRVLVQEEVSRILTRRETRAKVLGLHDYSDPFGPVRPPPGPNAPRKPTT